MFYTYMHVVFFEHHHFCSADASFVHVGCRFDWIAWNVTRPVALLLVVVEQRSTFFTKCSKTGLIFTAIFSS
jgi:hypothetical protein